MSDANKAAKRRYFQTFNGQDLSVFDDLFAPAYALHPTGFRPLRSGIRTAQVDRNTG